MKRSDATHLRSRGLESQRKLTWDVSEFSEGDVGGNSRCNLGRFRKQLNLIGEDTIAVPRDWGAKATRAKLPTV